MKETLLAFVSLSLILSTYGDCGRRNGKSTVEILLWPGGTWAGFLSKDYFSTPNYLGHGVDKTKWNCPVDCRYTTNKGRVGNVDAVIFEAQPITSYFDAYKREPPNFPQKFPHQLWVNTGYETEYYFNLYGDRGYMDFIDVNFTYYQHSQVQGTFTCMWGGGELQDLLTMPPPKKKENCLAWMATNCASAGATARTLYAKELREYIHFDSFGRCLHNKDLPVEMQSPIYSDHGSSMRNKIKIFSDYKFVLTFENNNVTDYVTEKLMNVLQAGSVPVYMGAPNVHPDWTPGEHSIVRVSDFTGPKQLAEYIQRVCDDDNLYAQYFNWKKRGFSKQFKEKFDNCFFYGAECRLCQYVLQQREKLSSAQRNENEDRRRSPHYYYALQLKGDQYVEIPHSPDFDLGKEFTISAWIFPHKEEMPILEAHTYTVRLEEHNGNSFITLCIEGECWASSHAIHKEAWAHFSIQFRFDENSAKSHLRFFINGVKDENVETPFIFPDPPESALLVGTSAKSEEFFDGLIDDLSLWKRTFDDKEAREMTWKVHSRESEGLVAYWSFNQSPSEAINDPKGHHGRAIGNPKWVDSRDRTLVTVSPCL